VVTLYAKWIGPRVEPLINDEVQQAVYGDVRTDRVAVAAGSGSGTGSGSVGAGSDDADAAAGLDAVSSGSSELGEAPSGAKPHRIGVLVGLLPLVVPILLIVLNTVITAIDVDAQGTALPADYEPSAWAGFFVFIADPVIALLIGLGIAVSMRLPRWTPRQQGHKWLGDTADAAGLH